MRPDAPSLSYFYRIVIVSKFDALSTSGYERAGISRALSYSKYQMVDVYRGFKGASSSVREQTRTCNHDDTLDG